VANAVPGRASRDAFRGEKTSVGSTPSRPGVKTNGQGSLDDTVERNNSVAGAQPLGARAGATNVGVL